MDTGAGIQTRSKARGVSPAKRNAAETAIVPPPPVATEVPLTEAALQTGNFPL